MYYTEAELKKIKISESQIERTEIISSCSIQGAHINSSHLSSPNILGGSIDNMLIKKSFIELDQMKPCVDLSKLLNEYHQRLLDLQTQNDFLLKLLVTKGILEDEKELQELINTHKLANKLSEGESNG